MLWSGLDIGAQDRRPCSTVTVTAVMAAAAISRQTRHMNLSQGSSPCCDGEWEKVD